MIIDANVFKGYFDTTMGHPNSLCGCPIQLLAMSSSETPIYHDSDKIIESEWQRVVDRDWFDAWLSDQLRSGVIAYVDPIHDAGLEKNLKSLGFPPGRDIVYIRVGLGAVKLKKAPCTFYTEDMDFYDPTQKKCPSKTRKKILAAASAPVCKALRKKDVYVSSVP